MRIATHLMIGFGFLGASVLPSQLAADAKIYPYPTSANYCPAGLQPITIAGVICCGTPNQHITYQQAKAHPVQRHKKVLRHSTPRAVSNDCPIGVKGC
jgi:hypothetical protein